MELQPPDLQLLGRPDCHLCEVAESILRELRLTYEKIDVDSDEKLAGRWGDSIPVILMGDQEIARAPITRQAIISALETRKEGVVR